MDQIYVGVDRRQWLAYTVLQHSIYSRATKPVQVMPLILPQLPVTKIGLTDFTYSRYLVPWLCGFKGRSLFVDADFLCLTDINELFALFDANYAVQVVQSKFRFEWPSLMLFNNKACQDLTPEFINQPDTQPQALQWGKVGQLPAEWNYLVGYDGPQQPAKMVHYTQGIPGFIEMQGTPYYDQWHQDLGAALGNCSWIELMGQSVHASHVIKRLDVQRNQNRQAMLQGMKS